MKGKIPQVQGMEDVLTSNVFGLLKYITSNEVLLEILRHAKTLTAKSFLDCVGFDLKTWTPEFLFWEQVGHYGEPDLIIKFTKGIEPALILGVEVKYYSSKGGEGDDDQLRRYFDGMLEYASISKSTFLGLIYLTKYPSRREISESLSYITEKGATYAEDKVFQLKWFEITAGIECQDLRKSLAARDRMILDDLSAYLRHKNLISFSEFSFRSKPFDMSPDRFYESSKFKDFTFLRTDFEVPLFNKVFYG